MQRTATIASAAPVPAPPRRLTRVRAAHTLRGAARVIGQCFLLWAIFDAADRLVRAWRLPLPANLIGLLLLLLLLGTGIVRPADLHEVNALVSRHLSLLFVPLAVGLMTWPDLLAARGFVLALVLLGAVAVGIATAGIVGQFLMQRASSP